MMQFITLTLGATLLVASLLAAPAPAAAEKTPHNPIKPKTQCLDMSRPRLTYAVDGDTVIAKTGPIYYLIALENACPNLTNSVPVLQAAHGSRYLCGGTGDKVYNIDGVPCAIQGMKIISQARFEKLEARAMSADR